MHCLRCFIQYILQYVPSRVEKLENCLSVCLLYFFIIFMSIYQFVDLSPVVPYPSNSWVINTNRGTGIRRRRLTTPLRGPGLPLVRRKREGATVPRRERGEHARPLAGSAPPGPDRHRRARGPRRGRGRRGRPRGRRRRERRV